jgi:HK97 gp10 family phage protein
MIKVDIKVTKNRLGAVGPAISRNLEAVVNETAQAAAEDAQRRAPVDTGFLRDNIRALAEPGLEAQVVSEAPYSDAVEFGTAANSPQPFFRPAMDAAATTFARDAAQAVQEGVEEAAG